MPLFHYYGAFIKRWLKACVHSSKTEVLSSIILTIITLGWTYRENGAWHTAEVGLEAILTWLAILMVFHLFRTPWLLQIEGVPSEHFRNASILSRLPVYRHDLRFELLALTHGVTLDFRHTTLFLKASLTSDSNTGISDITVSFTIGDKKYSGSPVADLSEWILRTPIKQKQWFYQNEQRDNLQDVSLWREVRQKGLQAGIQNLGWIGIQVPDATPNLLKDVEKVRVEVRSVHQRESYRFYFLTWETSEETILDSAFESV